MIKNSKFYVENLKNIVLFGHQKTFDEMVEFNNTLNIKTLIITSPDQKKKFKKTTKINSFHKLDEKFKRFLKKKINLKETLFVSIGSRWIFSKSDIENFFQNNFVNFHGTRLPYGKGGAFISWQILRNDRI